MRILVLPGVLRPPSDAALLGGVMARDGSGLRGREALDLCSGSGILGLTAAQLGARATAVDLSRRAVLNAWLNAHLNRLELEVLRGDLFAPVEGRRFDLVVSNPPYIPAPPDVVTRGAASSPLSGSTVSAEAGTGVRSGSTAGATWPISPSDTCCVTPASVSSSSLLA